jgi:two-component system, sensor histidine kinase PdtaS
VKEKDWLVKEIHHRVKNNFHTVMGLLGTQSGYLKNEEAIFAVENSKHRINAMSLIHQKLYQSENLSAIGMPDYIHELVSYLRDSFGTGLGIRFEIQIEPIELDLSHAMPIGLILNEAITNSIKYAFINNKNGLITISLSRGSDKQLTVTVADNGIGLHSNFDIGKTSSMGMNLMKGLSEDIEGVFSIENSNGTLISLTFRYDPEIHMITQENISKQPHLA